MPVKSKQQARFMGAIASGNLKKEGISKEKAKEFLEGANYSELPEKVKLKREALKKLAGR